MCSLLQSINRSAEECGSGEIYLSRTLQTQVRTSAEVGVTVVPPQLDIPFRGYLLRVGRQTHLTEVRKLVPMPRILVWGETVVWGFAFALAEMGRAFG
ncbi:MAG: hypothetical protein CMK09_12520 [Ponticaulis sp.]|nr:hypothetical protein [Ponticaulis sp.]